MAGGVHGRIRCMAGGGVWQEEVCGRGRCVAGGGAWQGGSAWKGRYMAGGRGMHGRGVCMVGACMAGSMHGGEGMHGRRNGHWSGHYASYWNASLFYIPLGLISAHKGISHLVQVLCKNLL